MPEVNTIFRQITLCWFIFLFISMGLFMVHCRNYLILSIIIYDLMFKKIILFVSCMAFKILFGVNMSKKFNLHHCQS